MRLPTSPRNLAIAALAAMALVMPQAAAQAQQDTPSATITANQGQDYAATELGNPWDMDSSNDIAYEYTRDNGQISNLRFEDGKLKGTTGADARVTLLVPSHNNVNPVLPEGGYKPIDASKYRYLTIKMNVSATSYANVYWQIGTNAAFNGWVETSGQGFKTFNAGTSVMTFDLGASSKWTGSVQGLYFDPHASAGVAFEIDYIRLSTQAPSAPDNNIPVLNITAPSYISGPDYAATELGNPWDMNDSADVSFYGNITNVSFNNGVLSGTNTSGDPYMHLHLAGPINPSKYKYLTYRFSVSGNIDTVNGSVARFIWWSDIPEHSTTSTDIVIYEGYRTVSFDLRTLKTESTNGSNIAWSQSNPVVFRFDPHEFSSARPFGIDYIMLTGDSTANASYDIRYTLSDADGATPQVQWYYVASPVGSNQPNAITCKTTTAAAAGNHKVYLPLAIGKVAAPVTPSGNTCTWNTSGVAAGTYYIYGVANDGTDSVGRYSSTPVLVSH